MTYHVLARKYRPKHFKDVVGQPYIVQALSNALDQQILHHAYLFSGTRGIGKTTLARIFAKCLNCEKGVSANPCDQCNHCQEIDAGRFTDFYEVDAASRTKVEDTRELLGDIQYGPAKGRYKVYLIDEVHMLSGHSFNALLKTLEEPPEYVKFLLATTEHRKLPVTVLSRCLQFHLQHTSPEDIQQQLHHVLTQEKINFDDTATQLIAKAANGSIRDALSLLDQCITFDNRNVSTANTKQMLGTIEATVLLEILQALSMRNGEQVHEKIGELYQQGVDFRIALSDLLSILHQINVMQIIPQATNNNVENVTQLQQLAATISTEDIQLFYQIGIIGQRDFNQAPDPKTAFEMTLLRMLAFYPHTGDNTAAVKFSADHSKTVPHPAKKVVTESKPSAMDGKPETTRVQQTKAQQAKKQEPAKQQEWHDILPQLKLTGAAFMLAQNCHLQQRDSSQLQLSINKKHQPLLSKNSVQKINVALTQYFQCPMQANIKVTEQTKETPSDIIQQNEVKNKQNARQLLSKDSKIQELVDKFDARIVDDNIANSSDTTKEENNP